MRKRQRDERAVAGLRQFQVELLAPETPVADHRALLLAGLSALCGVQLVVKQPQSCHAGSHQRLVGAIPRVNPMQQGNVTRLAHQHAETHNT